MSSELMPAITLLEGDYETAVRNANALLTTINVLRDRAGLPPKPPGISGGLEGAGTGTGIGGVITSIKPDTFYGKKLQTAVREYLEMRKAQNLGPAKPGDIFDAITAGGFQFEAKDRNVALIGMRALLRKRTNFFHKLPNGTYGLTAWYPDAKKPKLVTPTAGIPSADSDEDDDDELAEAV